MKTRTQFSLLLITLVILLSNLTPAALAQGPTDPNSAWAEVVNADGSINYASLTDGGVVNQPADWMPNIPLIGPIPAEYHVYYTPSGNSIVMPTASTLFFMAASANESGFLSAASTMGTSPHSAPRPARRRLQRGSPPPKNASPPNQTASRLRP